MARNMTTARRRARADELAPAWVDAAAPAPRLGSRPRSGTNEAFFPTEPLADDGGGAPVHRGLCRLTALHRGLLGMVLDEVARRAAELEHRHLALAAITEAKRHHRGADPGTDVDRAGRLSLRAGVVARAVETVHVAVAGDHPDRQLVEPRQRDLTAVRVPRQNQGDPIAPQTVGLLGDM